MTTQPIYYCVVDPEGILVHTTVSLSEAESIDQWLGQCRVVAWWGFAAGARARMSETSWKRYQAAGFKCLPVKLEVINL